MSAVGQAIEDLMFALFLEAQCKRTKIKLSLPKEAITRLTLNYYPRDRHGDFVLTKAELSRLHCTFGEVELTRLSEDKDQHLNKEDLMLTTATLRLEKVESSTIESVGYDSTTRTLGVRFKNEGLYLYQGVPSEVATDFLKAESKGTFLNNTLKSYYTPLKVELPTT